MNNLCVVVGSGLMVPSLLSTLIPLGYQVKVAGNVESELAALKSSFNISTVPVDVTDQSSLTSIIQGSKVVITMVPPRFHHYVLQACITCKINLVTPSYVSNEMLSLESAAKEAGIVVLNENGLDPGIDHMSVVVKLEEIRKLGARVLEFQSSCGAFPAPEACTNKLCYKLAWAPYGALLAVTRPAKYLKAGEVLEIPGVDLMKHAENYNLQFPLPLMHYPNGDSLNYPAKYGLEEAGTVVRSTLRYQNTPLISKALCALGIYNEAPRGFNNLAWSELISSLSGDELSEVGLPAGYDSDLFKKVAKKISDNENIPMIFEAFNELGLFSDKIVQGKSIFDAFVNLVHTSLEYLPGERDCVVMEHKFLVQFESGEKKLIRSRLVEYGVPNGGTSAISRLVSIPTALAADWICNNFHEPGFMYPMEEKFSKDVLRRLENEFSVKFVEDVESV